MKKIVGFLLAIACTLSSFTLFGCSNSNGGEDGNTLTVTIEDSNTELSIFTTLKNSFIKKIKEEEGIDITIKKSVFNSASYEKDIGTLIATDSIGDVVYTYDTNCGPLTEKGNFIDLNTMIENDSDFDMSIYDEEILNSAKTGTGMLGYFPRSYDQITLFINRDFFINLGMEEDIPTTEKYGENWENWTWDVMLELCAKLRQKIDDPSSPYYSTRKYIHPLAMDVFYNAVYDSVVKSFGGETVDGKTKTSGFDSASDKYAATVKAFDFLRSMVENNYTPAFWGAFTSGNNAMAFSVRPIVKSCIDAQIDVCFAPIPKFTKNQTGNDETETYVSYGSSGYAISSSSKNKDLAWKFIKYCVSEEGQRIIGQSGMCVPVIKSQQNADGEWTNILEDVDQSAFVFNGYNKRLATYARGVSTATEYNIYSKAQATIIDRIGKDGATGKQIVDAIWAQIGSYVV